MDRIEVLPASQLPMRRTFLLSNHTVSYFSIIILLHVEMRSGKIRWSEQKCVVLSFGESSLYGIYRSKIQILSRRKATFTLILPFHMLAFKRIVLPSIRVLPKRFFAAQSFTSFYDAHKRLVDNLQKIAEADRKFISFEVGCVVILTCTAWNMGYANCPRRYRRDVWYVRLSS